MAVIHNDCIFRIVRYRANEAIIEIQPLGGVFLEGETPRYITEKIENLTTNFGGGFEEWVKDAF